MPRSAPPSQPPAAANAPAEHDHDATVSEIRRLLDTVGDPCSVAQGVPMGLEEMGIVETVTVDCAGHAEIRLRLTSPSCMMVGYFTVEAERLVLDIPGVQSVSVITDIGLDWRPEMMSAAATRRRRDALLARGFPKQLLPTLTHADS